MRYQNRGWIKHQPLARARLVNTYGDVAEGEPLVLIASTDHLEIAVNMGSAQELFSAKPGAALRVGPYRATK